MRVFAKCPVDLSPLGTYCQMTSITPNLAPHPDQGEGAYLTMGEIGLVLGVGDVCWCTRLGL